MSFSPTEVSESFAAGAVLLNLLLHRSAANSFTDIEPCHLGCVSHPR
jgi:hypothetical protein